MPKAVMQESGGHPLARLVEPRWALPLLVVLLETEGERTFRLLRLLNATPRALRPSLDYCLARGWVYPNPGHGHPLRPEWILAELARPLARACKKLLVEPDDGAAGSRYRVPSSVEGLLTALAAVMRALASV